MSSNRWPLRAALASAACGALYGAAAAQTAPPLETLLREVSAPRLIVGEAETRAAEGRALQARAVAIRAPRLPPSSRVWPTDKVVSALWKSR